MLSSRAGRHSDVPVLLSYMSPRTLIASDTVSTQSEKFPGYEITAGVSREEREKHQFPKNFRGKYLREKTGFSEDGYICPIYD